MGIVILSLILWKENNSTNVTIKEIIIALTIDKSKIKILSIKKETIKKALLPSKLLLLYIFVFPYFMPIIAAKESAMLIINNEATIIVLSSNKHITIKQPSK